MSDKLARVLRQNRLNAIARVKGEMQITGGWIRFIRSALGMTQDELARRVGVSKMSVTQAERREEEGKLNLATLKKMAAAMECELVYAFVPRATLEAVIEEAVTKKAADLLAQTGRQMALEDQTPIGHGKERLELLKDEIRRGGKIW